MLNLNYDSKYDILYIGIGDRRNSSAAEEYDGLVILRDDDTNDITGVTIMGFMRRLKTDSMPKFPSGIFINIDNDILPNLHLSQ